MKKDAIDDMSRDELVKLVKDLQNVCRNQSNKPPIATCPFCLGNGIVPSLKMLVREDLIDEWRKDVTSEQYEAWFEKKDKEFK